MRYLENPLPIKTAGLRNFNPTKVPNPNFRMRGLIERFQTATHIDLEIGAGTGQFAVEYARRNPNRLLVSIERTVNKFRKFEARLHLSQPENLIACHTDGVSWLTHHLGPRKVDRCFFLYPNPSPKKNNQRWVRSPFFGYLVSKMSEEGEIIFVSNLAHYIEEVENFASNCWGLGIATKSIVSVPARTAFERKYLASGQICFEIVLKRQSTLAH